MVFYKLFSRKFILIFSGFFKSLLNQLNMNTYCTKRIFDFVSHSGCEICKICKVFHSVKKHILVFLFCNIADKNNFTAELTFAYKWRNCDCNKAYRTARSDRRKILRAVCNIFFHTLTEKSSYIFIINTFKNTDFCSLNIFQMLCKRKPAFYNCVVTQKLKIIINNKKTGRKRFKDRIQTFIFFCNCFKKRKNLFLGKLFGLLFYTFYIAAQNTPP